MKTQEEIEKLAESKYGTEIGSIRGSNPYDLEADRKNGFIKGYTQCQEDMVSNLLSIIEDYREKELPNRNKPFHYEAEISGGLDGLINFIKTKQND